MKFTLKPGNVAAMLHVTPAGCKPLDCIYVADQAVQVWPRYTLSIFPVAVRAAVNKHFGTMFALPLERRQAYIKSLVEWEIEA